jgi:hypothetical protein
MSSSGQRITAVKIPAAVTAVIGLVLAAVSLLGFVLDLLITPEIGALIVSFVVCGIGLTTGIMVLRRLAPRRELMSLFAGRDAVPLQVATPTELLTQRNECLPEAINSAKPAHSNAQITPVMKSHGSESIAAYKAHDGGGVAAFATVVGMTAILIGRLAFAWQFITLSILAGCAVALFLYWSRNKQASTISGYKIPVAGGVVGFICMTGLGVVMIRSDLLRDFFGLAVGAGGAVALLLSWARGKEGSKGSNISLV